MSHRYCDLSESGDLVLRSPKDCWFTFFFSMLGTLHGMIAAISFSNGRWESYLSAVFCVGFFGLAVTARRFRSDMTLLRRARQIRLRKGVGPLRFERYVPFAVITGVRLTLLDERRPESSDIELLCCDDDLHCPPSRYPRQEALLLAITLGVPLVKVFGEHVEPDHERINTPV